MRPTFAHPSVYAYDVTIRYYTERNVFLMRRKAGGESP